MSAERLLIWFLRLTALMLLTAVVFVLVPHSWMNAIHYELGLGALPDLPIIGYLTRSVSALYAGLGVFCWQLSRDVKRGLPILELAVPLSFTFGLLVILVDVLVEMPLMWTLSEGSFLLGWTLALWWLMRRLEPAKNFSPSEPEA